MTKTKRPYCAYIETQYGGIGFQRAATLEEAIQKCEQKKCSVQIVRRYVELNGVVAKELKA